MKQSQRIAKNMTVTALSEAIGFALNLVTIVVIARHLGVDQFGKYSFMLAFVWIFQLIADSGLSNIMIREIAVRKDDLAYHLGVTKSLIWVFSLVAFTLIVLTIHIINPEKVVKEATQIMGLAVLATVHAVGYTSLFRAMEEMEYNALGFIFQKICLLGFILLVVRFGWGLRAIASAYLASNVSLWFFSYLVVRFRYLRPKMVIDVRVWWYYVSEAVPIGIASILRKITWQVDILILSAISTATSVGLFSAAYKVIQSLSQIPHAVSIPLFPVYSRLAKSSQDDLFMMYEKSLKFMYLLCIPLVVILITLARSIILVVYKPQFEASSLALQILSFSLIFLFPTAQFVYFFSALNRQRLYTISSLACLLINIVLDFTLIPKMGFLGACIGTLAAEVALFGIGMYFARHINKKVSPMRALWKPFVSGLAMWALLYPFRASSPGWMLLGVVLSSAAYILTNIMLKTFSRTELSAIKDSILFLRKSPAHAAGN